MSYGGIFSFAVFLGIAVGSALYYIVNNQPAREYVYEEPRQRRYDNGYELPPRNAQPTTNSSTKDRKREKSKDNICVICYENLTKFITSSLSCRHVFHMACINQWLEQKTTCPICRKNVL